MNIIGISAFYHDSAACLVKDGEIIAAASEERFTRKKFDQTLPVNAIKYCLEEGNIDFNDIDLISFYEKPFLKFDRLLKTYLSYAPKGVHSFVKAMTLWTDEKLWIKEIISEKLNFKGDIIFPKHHDSHMASAFYPSPFKDATIITFDGVGEWSTTSFGLGRDSTITQFADIQFPHSLGLLYAAFTYYTGYRVNSGEYKVMGLAPYGEPVYKDLILDNLIDLKPDGSFRMNMDYFNYTTGFTMTNQKFHDLFGGPPREPESRITQKEMDLARSIQVVVEEAMLRIAKHAYNETGIDKLCLAGGVALNCVGNGKILKKGPYSELWIQPASGDAGGALGAALAGWYDYLGNDRKADGKNDFQKGTYLGPGFSNNEIEKYLTSKSIPYQNISGIIPETVAKIINEQNVVGWFQGRMEFGPRALCSRSIIGDARSPKMQEIMNLKIKFRESFRPFAPVVLAEKAQEYFDMKGDSPYMLLTFPVKEEKRLKLDNEVGSQKEGIEKLKISRSEIPAVTHVDYSARVQTVHKKTNPLFYDLLSKFDEEYGCPVMINTSFNVRGEPIVCTPDDAYKCFMRTNMDYLVMGDFLMTKENQPPMDEELNWREEFKLD
ncbi:MAG: carbamoyltransferase [Balneolaceae bacterium]|nr:carbamoyltransferase [Balneolaceae bacterium]